MFFYTIPLVLYRNNLKNTKRDVRWLRASNLGGGLLSSFLFDIFIEFYKQIVFHYFGAERSLFDVVT